MGDEELLNKLNGDGVDSDLSQEPPQ